MKKYIRPSLRKRLLAISIAVIVPMVLLLSFLLLELSNATSAYSNINQNVSLANQYVKTFKERIDYTMYLAVIKNKGISDLDVGRTTLNGTVTVNPYVYINELEEVCDDLAEGATTEINASQIKRVKNSLNSLRKCIRQLEKNIVGNGSYDENMEDLDSNVYMLTTLVQSGMQDYIYNEISNINVIQSNLDRQNRQTLKLCLLTSLLVILVSFMLTFRAAQSVYVPIKKLCILTDKVAEGDFTVEAKIESGDEIAVLTNNFNDMTKEIGNLVEDIKTKQENLRMIETRLLQAQINPHFLYNTLDAIIWLAEEKKTSQIVAIVTYLSDFFRTTLSKGHDFITIKDEELHITSYLKIQKFRYQDVLNYEIQIKEELYDYIIPKLLLQPLVENALNHGVRNKRGQGNITVTGKKENGTIVFQVTDDGRGMSKGELEKLRSCIAHNNNNATENGGFGIVNVNQRIHAYYGEGYGVAFESELGKGTEVTITIPAKNI